MKENWVFRSTEKDMLVVIEKFLKTQTPKFYPNPDPRSGGKKMNRNEYVLIMFYGVNWMVHPQEEIAELNHCSVRTVSRVISRFRKFIDQSGKSDWKKALNYFEAHRRIAVVSRIRFLKKHSHLH